MNQRESRGALRILAQWLRKMLWIGGRCICPKCEQGKMFETYYGIRKKCPVCGVTLQPYEGDSLGVIATGYFLTLLPAAFIAIAAWRYLHLGAYASLAVFSLASAGLLFGFYPNMKGIWVATVYLMTGFKPGT
jgi:uncharacterized protein (DUF983 family)